MILGVSIKAVRTEAGELKLSALAPSVGADATNPVSIIATNADAAAGAPSEIYLHRDAGGNIDAVCVSMVSVKPDSEWWRGPYGG